MVQSVPRGGTSPGGTGCAVCMTGHMSVRAVRCSRTQSLQCRWPSGSSLDDLDVHLGNTGTTTGMQRDVDVRPQGSRGHRRSATRKERTQTFGDQEVEDVVVRGASEQSHEETPQKLDCPLSRAGFSMQRFRRPAPMRAVLAIKMQKTAEGELLSRST